MSIRPENLRLPFEAIAGSDIALAITCVPHFAWDTATNKKSEHRIGSLVTLVCPAREYEKFNVVIEGENYDNLFIGGKPVNVSFEGFVGKFYRNFNTGEYNFTAKADKMIVAK